jgi:hypothetical protein
MNLIYAHAQRPRADPRRPEIQPGAARGIRGRTLQVHFGLRSAHPKSRVNLLDTEPGGDTGKDSDPSYCRYQA